MTDLPLIGLALALIVEVSHWTKFRWDFGDDVCGRAWQLSTIAILLAGVMIYLDQDLYVALPRLLTWMPVLLLPMQFVQSYGLSNSLPLNTFSFLASQRKRRNLRLGLTESVIHVNFGNIYFTTLMVASTLGTHSNSKLFLPGLIILTGGMLLSSSRSRPLALVIALSVAGVIAVIGQQALLALEDHFGNSGAPAADFDPNRVITLIGRPGTVEQSPNLLWRLSPEGSPVPPRLLRTGSYSTYNTGVWSNRMKNDKDFADMDSRLANGVPYYVLLAQGTGEARQVQAVSQLLPRFKLRGAAFEETPLPLPGDAASLRDFELDGIDRNSFGTVRLFPKQSIIEGTVLWKDKTSTEDPVFQPADLAVPGNEREMLQGIVAELRLDEIPTLQGKMAVLRSWFHQNFTYSRTLTIRGPTALGAFLRTVRRGHCEYFASAATMILRQAGIPARYVTGYAVMERDGKGQEFILRGTHGHAWTRVWDEKSRLWLDLDTTPVNWEQIVAPLNSSQKFKDTLQRIREDFFLWRNRPTNRLAASSIMSLIGLGVTAFVLRRLWKSKKRITAEPRSPHYLGPVHRTPLNDLEARAEKQLGTRPVGQPLAEWLIHLSLPDRALLDEAIELHQRLRFDPAPPVSSQLRRLEELTKQLDSALRRK